MFDVLVISALLSFAPFDAQTPASAVTVGMSETDSSSADSALQQARAFRDGRGVRQDRGEAAQWYIIAMDRGDHEASSELLQLFNVYGDSDGKMAAADVISKAAESGHVGAEYTLGEMYLMGVAARPDPVQARQWFEKSLDHGWKDAAGMLARIYRLGEGTAVDMNRAATYARIDAEAGSFASQYVLGEMYEKGNGVPQDNIAALTWYTLAAAVDPADCQSAVDDLKKKMSSADIATAEAQAASFVAKP